MSMSADSRDGSRQGGVQPYEQRTSGQPRNGYGIAALVLGLLALALSWTIIGGLLLGIMALIFGLLGRGRARRGQATNGGMSVAGAVLGAIGGVIALGLIALGIVFGLSVFNSPAGQNFRECLQKANGDRAMIERCSDEFTQKVGAR